MFEIIGMLVVGIAALAVVVAIVVIIIKISLILLPIVLFLGAICLFILFFCDGNSGVQNSSNVNRIQYKEKNEQRVVKIRNPIQREFHERVFALTRQKADVDLSTICPEMDSAIAVVVWAYRFVAEDDNFMPLVTSANDFEGHLAKSAHYAGAAVDFRIKDMGNLANRKKLVQIIRDE